MALAKLLLALGCAAAGAIAYSGDLTYYTPGLGACGKQNGEGDRVVALSPARYGSCANPNDCPNCDRTIRIHYNGKTTSAVVADKCPGCAGDSIDVSPVVFRDLADLSAGRIQVTWEYA